jgi:hypothetical protein
MRATGYREKLFGGVCGLPPGDLLLVPFILGLARVRMLFITAPLSEERPPPEKAATRGRLGNT